MILSGRNKITGDDFNASISGSGDIELELDVDYVTSRISGSGKYRVEWKVE